MSKPSQAITSNLIEFELLLLDAQDNFLDWVFYEHLIQDDCNVLDDIHEFTKSGVIL